MMSSLLLISVSLLPLSWGHGHITYPPSRHGGSLENAGACDNDACMWFSQPTSIPGKPTLPDHMRSYNVDVKTGQPGDWSAKMPWRSPGASPVLGSGCGIAGGNTVRLPNGGDTPMQGMDGLQLPKRTVTNWTRGSIQEVGFGILANHGGGYSYRLCPANGEVNETCFQRHPLKFAGSTHQLRHDNRTFQYGKMLKMPSPEIDRLTTTEGTWPLGSEWARVPVPACRVCDQSDCGPGLLPTLSEQFFSPLLRLLGYPSDYAYGGLDWFEQQVCAQSCSGINLTACPAGMTQFPEPMSAISGYTGTIDQHEGFPYSVMDKVQVPEDLPAGEYLLSWRWDCEQSHQIWQNCADVRIVEDEHAVNPIA